ncbi:hypothetical protein [Pseudoclavibacter sp. VKM Ac-2888]|uniref:hypothetical protein n=1 Tax=Pseudoclavibacter sp. VKM Ac-2888 TaxID=2783830 RepID=UPI00188B82DE|nr:hypothetical protein [Pseudoclavibacter sp. VKM Ac-2888]MBF4549309.1 hypothetical protein [Pseudoclavibacter sp. VKM Ac-2888]
MTNFDADKAREQHRGHGTQPGQFGFQGHSAPALNESAFATQVDSYDTAAEVIDKLRDEAGATEERARILELAALGNDDINQALVENSATPEDLVIDLIESDETAAMTIAAARRDDLPVIASEVMWTSQDPFRRKHVLAHRSCPDHVLEAGATSPDADERFQVAAWADRPFPEAVRERLLVDEDPRVLAAAASNVTLTEDDADALSQHSLARVRHSVAINLSTPPAVIERLALDEDIATSTAAARRMHGRA